MKLIQLLLILAYANLIHSGIVYRDTSRPISPFRNNVPGPSQTVYSDYTFNFRVQTPNSDYPILRITFPAIYAPLAAGTTYSCTFKQSSTTIVEDCIVEANNVIRFPKLAKGLTSFSSIIGASSSLTISGLTNPVVAAGTGTGQFSFSTYSQENVIIDTNTDFGTIGLSAPYTNFPSVSIRNDGAPIAGYLTNYVLEFTNLVKIPAMSWFRLQFPSGYGFGKTACSFLVPSINITCYNQSNYLYLTDVAQDLAPGTYRIKLKNIINPYSKGDQTGFIFESLKQGINTVIEQNQNLGTITITAGAINSPSITGSPLNRNLNIDYTISFTPSNTIPEVGCIKIIFPNTFGSLDSTCRIIYGLTASLSGITCTADSTTKTISISGFTETPPQYIQLKIKATNPNIAGLTPQFQISSYRSCPASDSTLIDENQNAGQLTIIDVENPFVLVVDLYKTAVNTSLNGIGPLDFRLYPKTGLPAYTSSSSYGRVWLQIPLWWFGISSWGAYRCNFGPLDSGDAGGCTYDHQTFRMLTPTSKGLDPCDLPISLESVRVTPIPGRWDFRVHTFISSGIPEEQDLWTMDIPAAELNSATGYSTSLDTQDADAVIRVNFRTVVPVPIEGAINFNMSTTQDIYANTAAWDQNLGIDPTRFGTNGFTQISCRILIGAAEVGYAGTNHPKANCVLFKGSATQNVIIQIRGFASALGSNTYVEVDIPNVQICKDVGMKCVFELTTAYTTTLDNPYTLNYLTVNLGTIQGPNNPILGTSGPKPAFSPTMICQDATYNWTMTLQSAMIPGDHILIKMPAAKFTFKRNGITSNVGNPVVIYVSETDEIYFLIKLTSSLTAGAQNILLYQVRNSNGETFAAPRVDNFTGVITSAIYWASYKEIEHITFAQTNSWTDGGIWNGAVTYYPNAATASPFTRRLNYNDMIPQSITFTVCHKINSDGGIRVTVPMADYQATSASCTARAGLTGQSDNNGFTTKFNCVYNSTTTSFDITGFNEVPQLATITLDYSLKTKNPAVTAPNPLTIETFYNNDFTFTNDYLNGTGVPALVTPGPRYFPAVLDFVDWLASTKIARVGSLVTFNLLVNLTQNLPSWTSANDAHILFRLDNTTGLHPDSRLECRHDGLISYHCDSVGNFVIKMPTNQFTGITQAVNVQVILTSRGAYKSSNVEDGIMLTKAGRYTLTAEAYSGGVMRESSQLEYEVFGKDFLKYWVYGINKGKGGVNLLRIYVTLNPLDIIPSSDDSLEVQGKIVIEFERAVNKGFLSDLGTGIADKGKIPCISKNLPILNTTADIQCTLLYGLFNNPTKIEIKGFNLTNATEVPSFEIHFPKIFNPDNTATLEVPKVTTRIYEVNVTSGDSNELFYHGYDLINVTYPQNPAPASLSITTAPTMNATALNVPSKLSIVIKPPATYSLVRADHVVIQLPLFWKPPKNVTCNVGTNTVCTGYPDSNWIVVDISTAAIGSGGITATFDIVNPPALLPATATIVAYYFHDFKMYSNVSYPAMGTTFVPYVINQSNITSPDGNYGIRSSFIFSFIIPEAIPDGGAIRILIPTGYTIGDTNCENDALSGSALQDTGFQCSINPSTRELIAYGFKGIAKNNLIVLKARLDNPATATSIGAFTIETHYIYTASTTLSTLIAQGTKAAPPIVGVTTSTIQYWDDQYLQKEYLYAGDIGPVDFQLNLPSALSTTDTLVVNVPTAFSLSPEAQPYCLWNNVRALTCAWDATTNTFKISTPDTVTLAANTNQLLRLTSLNGDNGKNGLALPTTSGTYSFTFKTSADGGTTTREMQTIPVTVYAKKFTLFYSTTEVINYNLKTSIKIDFQPETQVPVGGKLILYVPTKNDNGVFLFNDDLRSGIANGGSISCHDVGATFGFEPSCIIRHGSRQLGTPVQIEVTGWTTPLLITKKYTFRLNKVYNPPESGDDKHVVMRLESYSSSSIINAGLHYDFTIQKFDPNVVTAPTAPTTAPLNAAQSGVTFTVRFYSDQISRAAAVFDYFILEFPPLIPQPLGLKCVAVTNNDCVSLPGNNWVIYDKTDADVPATTYLSTLVLNAQQVNGVINSTASVLTSYSIRDRVAITKVVYPYIDYTNLVLQNITAAITIPSITANQVPYTAPVQFTLTFTVPSGALSITIPASGAIEITLPSTVTGYDQYCTNDGTSGMTGDYRCALSGQTYTVTGFDQINPGVTVILNFWAKVTTASITPVFTLAFYQDSAKTIKTAYNDYVPTPSVSPSPGISAYRGFEKLYGNDIEALNNFAVRTGDVAPFKFYMTPGDAFPTSNTVIVIFPTGVSVPTGATLTCGFNKLEAKACTVTSTSPLTISIESPHTPTLSTSTSYEVFITSFGSTATNKKGLTFGSAAGKYQVTVTVVSDTITIPIEIYPTADFTSLILKPFWSNVGVTNYMAFELQPSSTIPAGGKIVIEFPQLARDGTALFAADLGTNQATGTTISCTSETKSTFVPTGEEIVCTLYYISGTYTTIEITGFNQVNTTNVIEFLISGFKNPSIADIGHVHIQVHAQDASGTILNKRLVEDVFTPQTVTVTTPSGTYTRSKNNVQDTGVTYSLPSLTVNTGKTLTTRSTIILQFPVIFTIPKTITVDITAGGTTASFDFKVYANFIVITPTATFGTGVVAITLGGIANPTSKDDTTTSTIQTYFNYYRSYETSIPVTANPATDFATGTITVASSSYTSQKTRIDMDFFFELSFDKKIPAGGALRFIFPSFQAIKEGVVISGLNPTVTFTSTTSGSNQIALFTLGKSYSPSDGNIKVRISIGAPTTTASPTITIEAFQSASLIPNRLISTGTYAFSTTAANNIPALATTAAITNNHVEASQTTVVTINYVLASTTVPDPLTTEIQVDIGEFTSAASTNCLVNGVAPTDYCDYDGTRLVMKGFTLNAKPTNNVISFTLTSPSTEGFTRLIIAIATVTRATGTGIQAETTKTYIDAGTSVHIRTYASSFSSFSANLAHITANQPNILTLSMTTGSTVVNSPVLFVEFPTFVTNLGSYTNGATIPCKSTSHTGLKCTLEITNGYRVQRVRVDGLLNPLPASTTVDLMIFRVTSPSVTGDAYINVKIASLSVANYENNIYGGTLTETFNSNSATTSSKSLTLSSYTVRDIPTSYGLSLPVILNSGDMVFYHLAYTNYGNGLTPASPTCSNCDFYPEAGVLAVSSGLLTLSMSLYSVSNLNNPPGTVSSSVITAYVVQNDEVTQVVTINPASAYSRVSYASTTLKSLQINNVAGATAYSLSISLANALPSGGVIRISFPTSAFSTTPTATGLKVVAGTYTGTLSLTTSVSGGNVYFDITGITSWSAGPILLYFNMNMGNGKTGSQTGSVTTYMDNTFVNQIEYWPLTFTYDGTNQRFYSYARNSFILGSTNAVKSGNGIWAFGFKQSSATGSLTVANRKLRVTPPSTFSFSSTLPIRCKFTSLTTGVSYLSQECYKNTFNQYEILPPSAANPLAYDEWRVSIFTIGSNTRGLPFPSNNVRHIFTVNIESDTSVIQETNIFRYKVFDRVATRGLVDSYLNNVGESNLIKFQMTLVNSVPTSTGKVIIEFPMINPSATINAADLNTGLTHRSLITCMPKKNSATLTAKCRLQPGVAYEQKPTTIIIDELGSSLAAGDQIEFTLAVKNGITPSIWNNAQIYTIDGTSQLDIFSFEYVTYTSNPTASSTTWNFPTGFTSTVVQDTAGFTLHVEPSPSVTLTSADSRVRFIYNSDFSGGSSEGVTGHKLELWAADTAFVTFSSNLGATPVNLAMTGFKNPMSIATYTSSFKGDVIKKKVIAGTILYNQAPLQTFTLGTFTSVSVTKDVDLRNQIAQYTIGFTLDRSIPANGIIMFRFPTGYTLQANTCTLQGVVFTSCSFTGLDLTFTGVSAVSSGTTLSIIVSAKNPSTAGTTGTFSLYSYDSGNSGIATLTGISGTTISSTIAFNSLKVFDILSSPRKAQALDYAPFIFTLTLQSNLAKGKTNYVDFLWPASTPELVFAATTPLMTDLICRWGNLAASSCTRVTNGWRIYTPMETDLTSGSTYVITIATNRNVLTGFHYPVQGAYSVSATDSASKTTSKTFTVLTEAFKSAFIISRITTLNEMTLLYLRFTTKYDYLPATDDNRGQIIVELPTLVETNINAFPVDLGKGINNGDPLDCVGSLQFKCKLSKGGVSLTTPTSIILDPQVFIQNGTDIEIRLAMIRLPPAQKTHVPLRVYSRKYNFTTSTWTIYEELLKELTLYTTQSTIDTTQASLTASVFTPNQVGAPTTVIFSFNFKSSIGTLDPSTYDRLIIYTSTTYIRVQKEGVLCSQANVTTHQIGQWYEVSPTTTLSPSTTFQISFSNWTNVPYVIAGGIKWEIYVWKDGNLQQKVTYANTAAAVPHDFQPTPSIIGYNSKIRAVSTYEISFLPYNQVPSGGTIEIGIPKEYMSLNPQCDIQSLSGASCTIQDDGDPTTDDPKMFILKDFLDYDPVLNGTIKLKVKLVNPKIGGSIGPFTLTTKYPGGYLIDQNLTVYYMTIDASATFYDFQLNSLNQLQTKTCGGNPGPMKIKFKLYNTISYPTGFITITLDNAFSQPPYMEELLCYFTYSDIYNLKTHRCDWTGNQIFVYAPEEKNFVAGDDITLTITTRGANIKYLDGVSVPSVPGAYFVRVETSNNLEEGYPIANIPACPFKNFTADSIIWHRDSNTLLNFTMINTARIPAAASGGRIVVEIPTHNEIGTTFTVDAGLGLGATDSAGPIGCGGMCVGCPSGPYMTGDATTYTECTLMKAPGQNFGDRVIIFSTNLQQINVNTYFNFQVARLLNPSGTGWPYWTHIRIRTQMKAADGSYVDLNDHWAYFIVPNFLPTVSAPSISGPQPSMATTWINDVGNYSLYQAPPTLLELDDWIVYEFEPRDFILPSSIACDQNYNVSTFSLVRCVPFNDSSWISVHLQQNYTNFWLKIYQNMRQPHYQVSITIKGYQVKNHQITAIVTYAQYTTQPTPLEVVMQTPSNINEVSETYKYQIGLFLRSYSQKVQYMRFWMPKDFSNPVNCTVRRGLILKDVNNPFSPIICNITSYDANYFQIDLYNFIISTDWWCILDLVLTNPSTAKFTGAWSSWSYDNYNGTNTNFTRIMDRSASAYGVTWVGKKPFPNLFRVWRNTISFENRRGKENEFVEVNIRLMAKRTIPPATGNIEVWLPDSFDIPNGGNAVCQLGNVYHTDLQASSCSIASNRKVYMTTDPVYGIQNGTCNLLRITSENSANGNNGFQTSPYPGNYDFQVFMYNGSTLQEYSAPSSNVLPDPLTSLVVRVVDKEVQFTSVVRVSFLTSRTIPPGYDTDEAELDVFKKAPIGTIFVDFNTLDVIGGFQGWPLDLGFTSTTDIPCKIISGITPRTGYTNMKCTLVASTASNTKQPVRVALSNFETIVEGSTVEFHLLNLQTIRSINNNGRIQVGVYETFGDGSTAQILQPTLYTQGPLTQSSITPQIWTYTQLGSTFITPHSVGSVLIINFPYNTTTTLNAGDIFKLVLPTPQFEIPDDGSVSAVIDGIQLIPYIYNDQRINEIHFQIPTGYTMTANATVPDTKILSVSQLRDQAYADNSNFTIELWTIKSSRRDQVIRYTQIPPAPVSNFNSLGLVLSSLFSGDVFVSYDFTIVPSYHIPAGSTFKISLPSPQFDQLTASQPSAICSILSTALLQNCVLSTLPNTITFTASTRITESTRLTFRLTGVKNPTFVGTLPAGSINMNVVHPNGKLINQGNFTKLTFVAPKTPDKIALDIDVTSLFKSVDADYTFSLQNSNQLPVGGKVILTFPSDWKTIIPSGFSSLSSLTSSFSTQSLFYTMSYVPGTGKLQITTQFTWPAKTSLYIKINGLTNPSAINTTGVFRSSTIYDGVTIDQTDPLDTSTRITFETPPPPINVTSAVISPTNEGEPSTYSLHLNPGSDIPAGSQVELIFPSSYGPLLTTADITIKCSSPLLPDLECTVKDGRLIVPISANITAGTDLQLTITGITNPSKGTSNSISVITRNGNTTLQFSSNAITVNSTTAPIAFTLTNLSTTSTNLQAQANYVLCAETDAPIPVNAQVFIEFPEQFTLRQSSYHCGVTVNNTALTYPSGVTCSVVNNLRRFVMTGQSNSLPGGTMKSLCYIIQGVENPSDSGESSSFNMKVYDPATQSILYRSYGTLSYPTTIVYKRVGLRILVSDIEDFPIGLESDYVSVRLERSVPYEVQLSPSANGFSFDPPIIFFRPDLSPTQKFRIKPNAGTTAGTYFIQWTKFERSTDNRFAAVPNSFFNYIGSAAPNRYKVTLGTTVSRTALRGTSLPISVKLNQSPAKNMTIYYNTSKPVQPEFVNFNPPYLVFQPGELEKTFQYTTTDGAISGLIQFTLQTEFQGLYTMEQNILNFEILDIDNEPPQVLNEYIVSMDRTYMYYRISTTESAWAYYMLTLKGTKQPPIDEIKDYSLRTQRNTQTDVIEINGKNASYQTEITKTYIYYDIYVLFTGLEEQTDYVFYYVSEDLSGNFLKTRKVEFTTLKKHHPARFNIMLKEDTGTDKLIAAFSLITSMLTDRWQIMSAPKKFNIPDNSDPIISDIIEAGTVTYDIMLLQNATSDEKRPIETVALLENNKYILLEEIPQLVSDYDINKYSYEVLQFEPEFSYRPILLDAIEDYARFNVSMKRNGTLYAVVLPKGSPRPYARQIKYGLDSTNFLVGPSYYTSVHFTYPLSMPFGVRIHKIISFSNLFDNSEYEVHFVAENDLPVNPDLMTDDEVVTVSFVTQRELFVIPSDYEFASNLEISKMLLALVVAILLLL